MTVPAMSRDDPFLALSEDLQERIVDDWDDLSVRMSKHLALEIEAVRRGGGVPLEPGQPVPRCGCETCTGIPAEDPSRRPERTLTKGTEVSDHKREAAWAARLDRARSIPILEIATRLGCGDPVRRGRELVVSCPLHHDSDPSCRLDPSSNVWYCDPCGDGGDGIDLYMRARRLSFPDAVRELAA